MLTETQTKRAQDYYDKGKFDLEMGFIKGVCENLFKSYVIYISLSYGNNEMLKKAQEVAKLYLEADSKTEKPSFMNFKIANQLTNIAQFNTINGLAKLAIYLANE